MRELEKRPHIEIERPVEVPQRELLERLVNAGGRTVDEAGELTKRGLHRSRQLLDPLGTRDISSNDSKSESLRFGLLDQGFRGLHVSKIVGENRGA